MKTLLTGARILTPDADIPSGSVLIEDGRIASVTPGEIAADGAETIDLTGLTLAPGFIDVHVHGGGGFSLCTKDPERNRRPPRVGRPHRRHLPPPDHLRDQHRRRRGVPRSGSRRREATVVGRANPRPQPRRPLRQPRPPRRPPEDLGRKPLTSRHSRLLRDASAGLLRVMTVAPEVPGADRVIEAALAAGVRISVGHTDATFETAAAAFASGASHVTHAFNAMRAWHHREPGPLGAALQAPNVTVEVIADGVHLHPSTVQLLVSAFGPDRIALVTDAVTPAGLDSGTFRLGQDEARLRDGRMELPDGTIAGSAATMDTLVRNVVDWGVADLATAVRMASTVPARVAGVADRKGQIAAGFDADIVVLDPEMQVAQDLRRRPFGLLAIAIRFHR